VRRQDFSYHLPPELIAQTPLAERSASRMLVLEGPSGALTDSAVAELPAYLAPGDLLVFNDTRVVAARLLGAKPTGGRVEILLERALAGNEALAQLSASKGVREGLSIATAGGKVRVLERRDQGRVEVQARGGRGHRAARAREDALIALAVARQRRTVDVRRQRHLSKALEEIERLAGQPVRLLGSRRWDHRARRPGRLQSRRELREDRGEQLPLRCYGRQ